MPRFNGPYTILNAHPHSSTYTLDLPNPSNIYLTFKFHASQLHPFILNDPNLFPNREHLHPGPVVTEDGSKECFIDRILDEQLVGCGRQYCTSYAGSAMAQKTMNGYRDG